MRGPARIITGMRVTPETGLRIYLSARYARRTQMLAWSNQLVRQGHQITSSWLNDTASGRALLAQRAIADIANSEVLVLVAEPDRESAGHGGRHVEFGLALAHGLSLIVVGSAENVFHELGHVRVVPDWGGLVRALAELG